MHSTEKNISFILTTCFLSAGILFSSCENKRNVKSETKAKTNDAVKEEVVAAPETLNPAPETALMADSTGQSIGKAAGMKFGHINSAELIELMPETKKAEAVLAAYVKTLEGQFSGMQNDYQKKVTDFQAQERSMLENVKQTKIRAIQELELQLQETQAASREKAADKRDELFKPILKKAEKAVKDVSKENKYDYVFDTSPGSFIYTNDSYDIMPLVKKKLGIK